jgi:membrane carboxypeptidase/penicillin-binding protein
VCFGAGLYGVEAAARGYFGVPAADLCLAEAALLAGLVKAPSAYAPTAFPERAMDRRNLVLRLMREVDAIDEPTYAAARGEPLQLSNSLGAEDVMADYYREAVRQALVERLGADRVYAGGLTVYTTLDVDMQRAAEREVTRALKAIERSAAPTGDSEGPLQAALVALDPRTGEVRAMVGGRDFGESPFNRATQTRRQPGSAFKPVVYAAALEHGLSSATLIAHLDAPVATRQGGWVPDDEHGEASVLSMREALRNSSNRAAVQMMQRVGVTDTVDQARRLGLDGLPAVPSLALGTGEVTLLAMTRAFATFANQGLGIEPTLIRRVESSDGRLLFEEHPSPVRIVSSATAFLLTSMLGDVLDSGTARQARELGFFRPAAGKTGTTDAYHDAWFAGYTPYLVTGVWIGYDQPRLIADNGYASRLAVPLWTRFMAQATEGDPPHGFTAPSDVVPVRICRLSGDRANPECGSVEVLGEDGWPHSESLAVTEYFVLGREPLAYCPLHGGHRRWESPLGRRRGR